MFCVPLRFSSRVTSNNRLIVQNKIYKIKYTRKQELINKNWTLANIVSSFRVSARGSLSCYINHTRIRGKDGGERPEIKFVRNPMNRRDQDPPTPARLFLSRVTSS